MNWLWVAGGGALGVQRWAGGSWPLGTLAVNLLGSFLIGGTFGLLLVRDFPGEGARLFLTAGLLGGFTTFSAFSMETLRLLQEGAWLPAALYVELSAAGGLLAAWAGFQLAAWLA